ncbi:MAG: peptide-methionine (S)-S-oxide reductase MsrA [Pirellulaceae bacterium]|nr:peptide-methionine (S)-S-oxide reductase MsrA [Pirellulaceae bacterium]
MPLQRMILPFSCFLIIACLVLSVRAQSGVHRNTTNQLESTFRDLERSGIDGDDKTNRDPGKLAVATFGNGCYWCTEAIFEQLKGVKTVTSGFSGGVVPNPTYKQVLTGRTGHAEVVQIEYDPDEISFARLLEAFWLSHDPTTLNRQGPDVGTQYRSAVFYHDDRQREAAERFKAELNKSKAFRKPIVTEVTKFQAFYPAQAYHQDYFENNGRQPYCQFHIRPKLKKFKRVFREHLELKQ